MRRGEERRRLKDIIIHEIIGENRGKALADGDVIGLGEDMERG